MIKKTASVTAASIAGVILAGGAAIGANVGILQAADSGPLGELSAEVAATTTTIDLPPTTEEFQTDSSVVDTASQETLPQAGESTIQSFAIDAAGTIDLEVAEGALVIGNVSTNPGWTWVPGQATSDTVAVTFTSGGDVFEFSAMLQPDGTISANVDQPIIVQAAAPSQPAAPAGRGYDDDDDRYEDRDDDDDRYEDRDDDDDRYEDRDDDDDDDRYEGRDDDD